MADQVVINGAANDTLHNQPDCAIFRLLIAALDTTLHRGWQILKGAPIRLEFPLHGLLDKLISK